MICYDWKCHMQNENNKNNNSQQKQWTYQSVSSDIIHAIIVFNTCNYITPNSWELTKLQMFWIP